ncbi:MAG: substrate-binding domain-containing protein [Pseudomonadota bacterium]
MNTIKKYLYIGLLTFMAWGCSQDMNAVKVGASTTLEDSGLLSELIKAFENSHSLRVLPVIAGSGEIHQLIDRRDIHSAITHDPEGERLLLAKGIVTQRIPLMKNDFLIVGHANDPAHIKQAISPDEAFEKIINVGELFVSRADNSGTYQMEQKWWSKARIHAKPEQIIKTGSGMGETLTIAAERSAYLLVDRGTWLNFANRNGLTALFEDRELLPNEYSILSWNNDSAKEWEQWLLSADAKAIMGRYRLQEQQVFFPLPPQ